MKSDPSKTTSSRRKRTREPDYHAVLFGRGLRWIRQTRGLTQSEFAEVIGITRRTYIAWEHGDYVPGLAGHRKLDACLTEQEKVELQKWVDEEYE